MTEELDKLNRAADLLLDMKAEMRRLGMWDSIPPSEEALVSTLPFCCDTLSFPQWLQFVFQKRMKRLIEANAPLPSQCGIAPMAEEWFAGSDPGLVHLIRLLREFDELMSD